MPGGSPRPTKAVTPRRRGAETAGLSWIMRPEGSRFLVDLEAVHALEAILAQKWSRDVGVKYCGPVVVGGVSD